MTRSDLALALISQRARSDGERYPLDRIRLQKAIFLLTQRGNPEWQRLYAYEPYNWGPYSSQLATDMDSLVRGAIAEVENLPDSRYGSYGTTSDGEKQAADIWAELKLRERDFIRSVRAYVTRRSFVELLREIYAAYPEYATASQFTG